MCTCRAPAFDCECEVAGSASGGGGGRQPREGEGFSRGEVWWWVAGPAGQRSVASDIMRWKLRFGPAAGGVVAGSATPLLFLAHRHFDFALRFSEGLKWTCGALLLNADAPALRSWKSVAPPGLTA